ncbi:MAG: HAD family phosphatase [Oscillospiraceae bacterium]|jgi:beta-phosphoglucomutase|nr:HAD family phosphatase [Oscillospiraceae bacterium]
MKNYFLFDMDGVLMDSEPLYLKRLQRHMAHYGVEYSPEELEQFVGKTSVSIAETMVRTHDLPLTPQEFLAEEARHCGSFYLDSPELALFPGAEEFLDHLRERGIGTALVSSTSSKSVLSALDRFGMVRRFDAIVCRDMVSNTKPSPEPYLTAARFLGAQAGDCLVVEDSPVGIAAGKAAGMTVAALRASAIRQDITGADLEAGSYQELRGTLEEKGLL